MTSEVVLTRAGSLAGLVERLIADATTSVDAALYRFNNPRLARALEAASGRGIRIRLVLDRNKYDETPLTREILAGARLPFRLMYGRQGPGSKMHHKFALFDERTAVTGSYNWTLESEEQNYENLLVLHAPTLLEIYRQEFEGLWEEAVPVGRS